METDKSQISCRSTSQVATLLHLVVTKSPLFPSVTASAPWHRQCLQVPRCWFSAASFHFLFKKFENFEQIKAIHSRLIQPRESSSLIHFGQCWLLSGKQSHLCALSVSQRGCYVFLYRFWRGITCVWDSSCIDVT